MPWLPDHKPKSVRAYTQRKYDEEGNNLYKTERWQRFSRRYKDNHPLCVGCLCFGRVTMAQYTDHVFPWRGVVDRFWNNFFQSLCSKCHGHKRGNELRDQYYYYKDRTRYVFSDKDYEYWIAIANGTIDESWLRTRIKN